MSFLRANSALRRGDLDAVTSDDPPAPEPASASAGGGCEHGQAARWARTSLLTISGVYVGGCPAARVVEFPEPLLPAPWRRGVAQLLQRPRSRIRRSPRPIRALHHAARRALIAPGEMRWKFKCLVPAHHMAHMLFVCWTNGVPVLRPCSQAYFKVGNTPMDQDLYISCGTFPACRFQTQPNDFIGASTSSAMRAWCQMFQEDRRIADWRPRPA